MSLKFWLGNRTAGYSKTRSRKDYRTRLRIDALEDRAVPAAPVIAPLADRTLLTNQTMLQVPVVASDADGDTLTYSVRTAGSESYFLLSDLKLVKGNRATGWAHQEEKWFQSRGDWYFLKPNGDLHKWDGVLKQASGELIASLPPVYFHYTDLVTKPRDQDLASLLNQRLGLVPTVSPVPNALGLNEKWLAGSGGARYMLLPDGSLYRASGVNYEHRTLYASLNTAYYQNPRLLSDAQPRRLTASMHGSVVQIDEANGASGMFAVEVTARDQNSVSNRIFHVMAPNLVAPEIPEPAPQVLGQGEQALSLDLAATDGDGDALTYSVKVAGSEAYYLTTDLALKLTTRPNNWAKQKEKWFQGQGNWYFLLPSGDLYKWNNTPKQATGDLVATLAPVYYYYTDLLTKPRDQDLAYVLDQRLGLFPTAKPFANSLGLNEKWLGGADTLFKFFITPEGSLFRRQGASMVLLADLGSGYHSQPARLYAASRDRFSADVDANGILTIKTKPNYIGTFSVQISASDGLNNTTQVIPVTQSDFISPAAPRVVGAVSTGNQKLIVSFSQPMNNAATNPANYQVAQVNAAGTNIAGLGVLSATFVGTDRTTIELATISQSEVNYSVTASNMKDLGGTALAPPTVSNGVVIDPTKAGFLGKPPSSADMMDTDGDGLQDHKEQRGWAVQVTMLNGSVISRWVTSDPFDPDSDGDGLSDAQEANLRFDPRDADGDDDQLNDFQEFNEIFSDGMKQDTDGDSLDDSLEYNFFRSSPVEKDTDGDQILDGTEILLGNRNPRISDLPKPGIEVGTVDLQLDVRFTATSVTGTRTLDSKTVSTTLTQTEGKEFANTDASSNEFATKVGYEQGWSASTGEDGFGAEGKFSVEAGYTGQWTSSFTETSTESTQSEVAKSFQSDVEATQEETVQREVLGASMKVGLSIKSLANIAFTLKNLQVTAFVQDPRQAGKLIPIATLLPDTGVPNEFTLGPLVPERGPFIFSSDQVFPALVQELMVNPQGLIFKVANYDMTDERSRNFAFSSQEINDRTAPIVIDFGFGDATDAGVGGTTERYRVATSGGRIAVDTNGDGNIDDDDRPVVFNPNTGKAVGITIIDAMENIVGLTKYDELVTPSSTLSQLELEGSYSTKVVNGVERLWRIRTISKELGNPLKSWTVFTSTGIDATTNFSDLVLTTENGLTFKFLQDLDNDGIDAAQEYILGSSDSNALIDTPGGLPGEQQLKGYDTDLDGLSDAFEFFGRMPNPGGPGPDVVWNVEVSGKPSIRAYSSPAREDSDLDGLSDAAEFNRFVLIDDDGDPGTPDISVRFSLNPRNPDTDGDGVSDFDEINGYQINLRFPAPGTPGVVSRTSDPLNPDTDGDTLPDGDEKTLGTDPRVDDADKVLDDDGDRLVNFLEDDGYNVTTFGVSTTADVQGTSTTVAVTSAKNDPDSDDDGLNDKEERTLGTNPRAADTDGDGVNDIDETTFVVNGDGTRTFTLLYNPLDADTDNDKRSESAELNTPILVSVVGATPYEVFSDPTKKDVDNDGLFDGDELAAGTDPTKFDTDGDNPGIGDKRETQLGTNPLKRDQKVTFTVTQIQLTGGEAEDGEPGSSDDLEVYGSINLGITGSLETIFTLNKDTHVFSVGTFYTINVSRSFILSEGASLTLQNSGLYDEDPGIEVDDPFDDASQVFNFPLSPASGTISSPGNGSNLVTSYTLSIDS